MTSQVIPAEAVEAAARAMWAPNEHGDEWAGEFDSYKTYLREYATKALEAAAPYMLEQVERELTDAKRVIAMLILEAGGKVTIGRRAVAELSDETIIETTQDVITGGWVIRAKVPGRS